MNNPSWCNAKYISGHQWENIKSITMEVEV